MNAAHVYKVAVSRVVHLYKQVEGRPETAASVSQFFSPRFLLISSLIILCMESDIDRLQLSEVRVRSRRCAGKQITLLLIRECRDQRLQQNHLLGDREM